MAVYTPLSAADVAQFLAHYDVGTYLSHQGITGGIENTNYFVATSLAGTATEWVLTVFERLSAAQLPYYLELCAHLGAKDLNVTTPCRMTLGGLQGTLHGKPAALTQRLAGADCAAPSLAQIAAVGELLARMHLGTADFAHSQDNLRGLDWIAATTPKLFARVSPAIAGLLADELAEQQRFEKDAANKALPRGAVHADLFLDNVLFDVAGRAGAIDFYFAGSDAYVYDLCVTVNDWCIDRDAQGVSDGALNAAKQAAFMNAYSAVRPLSADEMACMPMVSRRAALRFWVSRLDDWYSPRAASQLQAKDPTHFERMLRVRRAG